MAGVQGRGREWLGRAVIRRRREHGGGRLAALTGRERVARPRPSPPSPRAAILALDELEAGSISLPCGAGSMTALG
ncbi:hypothetical protein ACP4OV_023037 [Aristida adscensionis]